MIRKKWLLVFVLVLALCLLSGEAFAGGLPRVTGSGHVYDPGGGLRIATITARMMPDGTIQGDGQGVVLLDQTVIVHFKVDCVRTFEIEGVEGKGAVVSGWSTKEKNFPPGAPVPAYLVVAVFDAGEGNESGDIFSRGIPAPDPEYLDCNDTFPWPLTPLEYGNVQVDW
ncbi:MAG TPA: hypothetical protein VLA49_07400 [Anaerolineales bacterium]|nr:hypothetical protein [Anaerolineales bacterium]